jgi:predicted regulator of Ras-like GTPase activity (Roadblock/LC7/MglB family)
MPGAAAAPRGSRPVVSGQIELPVSAVIASLPLELRAKLAGNPPATQTISLPAEQIINQLALGAVKISFGTLRQLAPGLFVNSGGELDGKLISLPLHEILPRVNPTLLARRSTKKIEVSDEITGPFADRGRGFTFTTQALKGSVAPAAPAPRIPGPPASLVPPQAPRPAAPATPPPARPRAVSPARPSDNSPLANPPVPGRTPSLPISPLSPPPAKPAGNPPAPGHTPSLPISPLSPQAALPPATHTNGAGALPPGLRLGSLNGNHRPDALPALHMSSAPPAAAPQPAQSAIFARLRDLCDHWPEPLKSEILDSPLAEARVPLEAAAILPGLKRGRVVMPWKQLRLLAQPGSAPSPHDNVEVELPLKIIAPLFLAGQKGAAPQTKATVSKDIPDLFFGFPQPAAPEPEPPPAPAAATPAPAAPAAAAAPATPAQPKPAAPKPPDTNFYVWGEKGQAPAADETIMIGRGEAPQTDFLNRLVHPKDIVAKTVTLPGVAGAVIAMQDGLRVASQAPADLNGDLLAAFLPQIFERVNQSTRELRMGALNNVSFTVGNVPWKIFRVNSVYFAAFGRAGEPLPSAQLAQLAALLDRKKQ